MMKFRVLISLLNLIVVLAGVFGGFVSVKMRSIPLFIVSAFAIIVSVVVVVYQLVKWAPKHRVSDEHDRQQQRRS